MDLKDFSLTPQTISDENQLSNLLLDKLSVFQLNYLQEIFEESRNNTKDVEIKKCQNHQITQEEFCQNIVKLFGRKELEAASQCLYRRVCNSSLDGTVTWEKFLDFLLNHLEETCDRSNSPLDTEHGFKLLTHNKRECTVRMLWIDGTPPVYLFVSKLGSVGVYSSKLRLMKSYTIEKVKDRTEGRSSIKHPSFVNDVVHMTDCKKLAIATSRRTLHFYDISASNHMQEFRLDGLPSVPLCLTYSSKSSQEQNLGSQLFVGYGNGNVHRFCFSEPETLLFKKSQLNQVECLSFQDIEDHKQYVTCTVLDDIHYDAVNRILYLPNNDTLITCSDDICRSVVIRDVQGKRKQYILHLDKGVRCCDYSKNYKVLVTGGLDKMVRMWDPYCPNQPTSCLQGHDANIIDIKIHLKQPLIFSYSQDGVLKVWSVHGSMCLQTVRLNFPTFFVLGHDPEHGHFSLHIDTPAHETILITCSEWVTEFKLKKNQDVDFKKCYFTDPQELSLYEKQDQMSDDIPPILCWSSKYSKESNLKHSMDFIKSLEEFLPELSNKSKEFQGRKPRNKANDFQTISTEADNLDKAQEKTGSQEDTGTTDQPHCQLLMNGCISTNATMTNEVKNDRDPYIFTPKTYFLANGQILNDDTCLMNKECNSLETGSDINITEFLKKVQEEKDDEDREITKVVVKELPYLDYLTEEQKEETIQSVRAARKSMACHLYRRMKQREEAFLSEEETMKYVKEGAPHWSLKMHPLLEILFLEDLPLSERMRNKGMIIRNEADVRNLDMLSLKIDISDSDSRRSSMASGASRRTKKLFRPALAFVTTGSPSRRSSNTSSKSSASSSTLKVPLKISMMKRKSFT